MEIQGIVKEIFNTEAYASGLQKREMVILTEEQYPQPIIIQFLNDKISLLDSIMEGEKVKVSINIRGKEWVSPKGEIKYFNSIIGWKVQKGLNNNSKNVKNETRPKKEDDDLPF